jgi:glycerol-3-phosphate acyltransferase PlsY
MLILVARRARSLRAERIIDMPTGEIIARYAAAAIVGYLVGSIPNGVLVGKLFGNRDPRAHGSGKTGTTNVLRTLGVGPAALVMVLDTTKGVAAVLLARFVLFPAQPGATATMQAWAEAIAGLAAILGHNYSIFIRFAGGRGVATGGGAILAMNPLAFVCSVFGLIVPIVVTRYVSLGSIIASATAAIVATALAVTGHEVWPHAVFMILGAAFVIVSHGDNIQRLLAGTERRLGQPST